MAPDFELPMLGMKDTTVKLTQNVGTIDRIARLALAVVLGAAFLTGAVAAPLGYLAAVLVLDVVFLGYAFALWRNYSDDLAKRTFRWSIIYLTLLFAALLVDHFLR